MEQTTNKQRTPSKCREWERQRRNKFNDAISKLGEIVKAINKANSSTGDGDADNVQYPKIEIIQKAIICLTNYAQEKTQLKAEILALEVKLEGIKKSDKKDVSIQVSIVNKKNPNGKFIRMVKLQKSKQKAKDLPKPANNKIIESKTEKSVTIPAQEKCLPKLPKLLPLSSNTKKGPENTLVMLPATPYIFPQRPLLFPTVPPTIVLVDTNLQPLNKPSPIPIINRNSTDITKTTMVNILPISAYSRPLSATKSKKNNSKAKSNNKKAKKVNPEEKADKETIPVNNEDTAKEKPKGESIKDNSDKQKNVESEKNKAESPSTKSVPETSEDKSKSENGSLAVIDQEVKISDKIIETKPKESNVDLKIAPSSKAIEKPIIQKPLPPSTEKPVNIESHSASENNSVKTNKNVLNKEILEEKTKETKLPNILEATMCENVDGGNARLELAEELLAASPTAAFLMSFPLVSGNRADSPAEDTQNPSHSNPKDSNLRRNEVTPHTVPYFEKPNILSKVKSPTKNSNPIIAINKPDAQKYISNNIVTSKAETKTTNLTAVTSASNENPFLNLTMPSLISTSCSLTDSTFGMDFDCNVNKTTASHTSSYVNSSNIFYKGDPFNTVKNTIYSTSSISSGHDFNSLGLYPCAMEKYTTKSKTDYSNVEDNLMKIGSSRLTYDIDLGWSHKSFDFVNCTTSSNTFNKENILTSAATTYSTSYNPFNPDFHVPLVTNTNKKDHVPSKPSTSFPEAISSLYSQTTNLWTDDVPLYNNPNLSKNYSTKQNYLPVVEQPSVNVKTSIAKQYEIKHATDNNIGANPKASNSTGPHQMPDTKKSPSKMHINWMTSEIRPMQNNCNQPQAEVKNTHKPLHSQVYHVTKKQDHNDSNYFPINMHNYPTQPNQEEFQVWPTARPAGTTEISIDPPPINLPTLVGDLALGPHDKKKTEMMGQRAPQPDLPNCSSFLSVTQLMNRSSDNMPSRYYGPSLEAPKPIPSKQNVTNVSDTNRKAMPSRLETNLQPSYIFNDPKQLISNYENMTQFSQSKSKPNKTEKSTKNQKNNYSAEALIRGGTCSQKTVDNTSMKFMAPSQKYNDFNIAQDSSVAQVSHFPPIIDYSDNSYTGQQFSGTTLYNSTTNTISNSFYSNFMPGGTNLMAGNYTGGPFTTDFMDYNQAAECNYTNHKYEELKMKNNSTIFHQDKLPTTYKSTRRESAAKHKLECSKKESTKKYQSKRAKLSNEVEEWNDNSHLLWQNKPPTKRHSNLMSEEIPFPNYVGNQMSTNYQTDFFNGHLMSSNMQNMGHHNVDRSLASFPVTSRANFNLSTIFPEITMKVQ
ncbi:uncharacterized protein [Epargyreus clarus]|uniref:uncharacterized protein n=1 Tax=Epargyreus clarus TaxID=520877 RepID=UPI003C30397D